jgi:hypothetical protein
MPGRRAYHNVLAAGQVLSAAQRRRYQRDLYYDTSHSATDKVFVEVDRAVADDAKCILRGKSLQCELDKINGWSQPSGKRASHSALKSGFIIAARNKLSRVLLTRAHEAKHRTQGLPTRRSGEIAWADINDGDTDVELDNLVEFPPLSLKATIPLSSGDSIVQVHDRSLSDAPLRTERGTLSDAGAPPMESNSHMHDADSRASRPYEQPASTTSVTPAFSIQKFDPPASVGRSLSAEAPHFVPPIREVFPFSDQEPQLVQSNWEALAILQSDTIVSLQSKSSFCLGMCSLSQALRGPRRPLILADAALAVPLRLCVRQCSAEAANPDLGRFFCSCRCR